MPITALALCLDRSVCRYIVPDLQHFGACAYAQAPNVVRMSDSTLLGKVPLQVLIQGVHELLCVEPFMAWIDEYGQILGHLAALNGRDDGLFQCFREIGDLWVPSSLRGA